jgi:hypothetical protein
MTMSPPKKRGGPARPSGARLAEIMRKAANLRSFVGTIQDPAPTPVQTTDSPAADNELAEWSEDAYRAERMSAASTPVSKPESAPAKPSLYAPVIPFIPVGATRTRTALVEPPEEPTVTAKPLTGADAWPKTCKKCEAVTAQTEAEIGTLFGWRTMKRHKADGTLVKVRRSQPYCRPCRNAASKASAAKKRAAAKGKK